MQSSSRAKRVVIHVTQVAVRVGAAPRHSTNTRTRTRHAHGVVPQHQFPLRAQLPCALQRAHQALRTRRISQPISNKYVADAEKHVRL